MSVVQITIKWNLIMEMYRCQLPCYLSAEYVVDFSLNYNWLS